MMVDSFSPLTRRILALGILALLLLLGVRVAAGVAEGVSGSLEELGDRRFVLARLEAVRSRPAPVRPRPLPPGLHIQAASHEQASAVAAAAVRGAAAAAQFTLSAVSVAPPRAENPALIELRIAGKGPELSALTFVEHLERGQPAIRLRTWQIAADPATPEISVEGIASAAWGPGQ